MNLRQKVGQLIIIAVPAPRLTSYSPGTNKKPGLRIGRQTAEFLRENHPAGVILFGNNLFGPWATAQLADKLQAVASAAGDSPLLIAMDQEGGSVAHLRYPLTEMPTNMARAAAGGPQAAREVAEVMGREMVSLGINLALAPVVDVNTNPANPVVGTRAFSDDPELVAACGVATIEGLRSAGSLSMAKHFPGHGDTSLDSHLGLPSVAHDRRRLDEVELLPFRAAIQAGVDSICSAHVRFPGIDDSGLPATLAPGIMTDLLRAELGFKGALFADALVMDAIARRKSANIPPAAVAAVRAGVDCVMVLGSLRLQDETYDALLGAVQYGVISERRLDEAVERVQALRSRVSGGRLPPMLPVHEHAEIGRRVARRAVTVVRDERGLLPLRAGRLGVVEFAAAGLSPVETSRGEPINGSTVAALLGRRRQGTRFLAMHSSMPRPDEALDEFLAGCDVVVLATRDAVLDPLQIAMLRRAAARGKQLLHVALRRPYDVMLAPEIGTAVVTYSDQPSSVAALIDVLVGDEPALGRLPIRLDAEIGRQAAAVWAEQLAASPYLPTPEPPYPVPSSPDLPAGS